jgi:hypothetical protein
MTITRSVAFSIVLAFASVVQAQDTQGDIETSEQRDGQLERGGVDVAPEPGDAKGIDAADWAIPALAVPDYKPLASELLREGAMIHRRQGRLLGSPGGGRVFVFDELEGQPTPAPMIVMPSVRLTEMERLLTSREGNVTFLLTGETFVYQGRNYVLPAGFTTLEKAQQEAEEGAREVQGGDETGRLIESLRAEAEADRAGERRRLLPRRELARDGEMITSKRGRVRRSGLGGWEFITDNDVSGGTGRPGDEATPHVLLPCLLLESIERDIGDTGKGEQLVLSGTIHVYEGEGYLLPSSYRLVRPDAEGLSSGQ